MKIALIAHDNLKKTLVDWVQRNQSILKKHTLVATKTTGSEIESKMGINLEKVASGPKGGDVEIASQIVRGEVQMMIFLWDPLSPHPHDVDVRALLRIAVLHDIPTACNLQTAECLIKTI